ncbi:MAG: elongation factor P [Candidatus Walczuchella monophlebidarum]
MASTSDIRKGLCIRFNNNVYKIIDFLHVKPGKGPAFVRTKLRNFTTGKVFDKTFPAGHKIEKVFLESHNYQFLYEDKDSYHFMNTQCYNQVQLTKNFISKKQFLKEGMEVTITFQKYDETPLSVEIPTESLLKVIYTEPGLKGDTVTNARKLATLETGAVIQVPLFIKTGDNVKINIENGVYIERV